MTFSRSRELLRAPGRAIALLALLAGLAQPAPSPASDTPDPTSVTVAGSLQDELGCPGDWQADCAATHLVFDSEDRVWQGVFTLPAGSFEYKAPLNDSWDENYGLGGVRGGPNIPLTLGSAESVKFYYDHESHWITDNVGSTIAVAPGSFQSELGCPGDWDPSCLRSWLQDPDGDGTYSFTTFALPAGSYEAKVAIDESWTENYGAGGVPNGANIPFTVATDGAPTVFSFDSATNVLTVSAAGAPAGNLNRAQAHWVLEDTLAWNVPVVAGNSYRLHWDENGDLALDETGVVGGQSIALSHDPAGLPQAVQDKFPHLADLPAFKIAATDLGLVPAILRSRFAVSAATAGGDPVDATSLQIPGVLDDLYAYAGSLGVVWNGAEPRLAVWAPTARSVSLLLFADAQPATVPTTIPMSLDAATGVWSVAGTPSWKGQYYLYEVEVWAPSTAAVEVNQVTDPYSLSLSADSQRSQIVDLDDSTLKPPGWDHLRKPRLERPEDVVLYELHVRDFSIADDSLPPSRRGTFRAVAEPHSDGMRHLAALARAGLTHVHLLPAFDFATVPERRADQATTGDLSAYPPDSDQQQAAVAAIRDQDGFNWGYDPFHYTVPEGSYSTDPDGPARIRQFREMVRGLSRAGLRVVMDVVYNHTTASGQSARSVLDRIVPGYYHRLNADGFVETSTCCANTASEHTMMGKLMRDSLVTWAKAYKVDGFRFDLMGHHMKANLLEIRDALAALTLEDDGVDGSKIYLYGEGWNFGEVANNARGVNATQLNMPGTGIGTFSDRLRDAARGGNPFGGLVEQGFLNGLYTDSNGQPQGNELDKILLFTDQIKVGLAGNLAAFPLIDRFGNAVVGSEIDYNGQPAGYTQDPQEVITYVEAHDNETLFDAVHLKAPASTSMAERVRMQNLGVSLVALGQGIPFFHAGVDLLRSKSLDRNSYNSGDWFNAIDWTGADNGWGHGLPAAVDNQSNWPLFQPLLADLALKPTAADAEKAKRHLREMLEIRKSSELFRLETGAEVISRVRFHNEGPGQVPGLLVMSIGDPGGDVDRQIAEIVVIVNVDDQTLGFAPAGLAESRFELHPVQRHSFDSVVRTASYDRDTGIFTVPGRTAAVFVAKRRAGHR